MTSAGKDVPAGSAPANTRRTNPPLQRRVVSRLLGPGADEAAQKMLVYSIDGRQAVLVEANLPAGALGEAMREQFRGVFPAAFEHESEQPPEPLPISSHYMRCLLTPDEVAKLARQDAGTPGDPAPAPRTIYRIWPDFRVHAHIDRSLTTIKSDAAARTYGTSGDGIIWAVVDSGIDQARAVAPRRGASTGRRGAEGKPNGARAAARAAPCGPGTHVAGITAGAAPADLGKILIATNEPTSGDLPSWANRTLAPGRTLSGMAPKAHLVSLRVLDAGGNTASSVVIEALAQVRAFNADGRQLVIHGVNLSIGCDWYPDEFAAGQSPLCRELDLLVGTGVVAVVSAGNAGAGRSPSGGR